MFALMLVTACEFGPNIIGARTASQRVHNKMARRRDTKIGVYPTGPRLPAAAANALRRRPIPARSVMFATALLGLFGFLGLMFVTT